MPRIPLGLAALAVTLILGASVMALQGCSTTGSGAVTVAPVGQDGGPDGAESKEATLSGSGVAEERGEQDGMHVSEYQPTGEETAVIRTSKGDVTVRFYPEDAPNTVGSFIELAKAGFYDGIRFHRVEPGFVVQGGDPLTKGSSAEELREVVQRSRAGAPKSGDPMVGTGGPGWNLKAEFNGREHLEGTLAMARSQHPDSAGSQFYICLAPQPFLDGEYTVFGQVEEGMDVVKEIEVGDLIESLEIIDAR